MNWSTLLTMVVIGVIFFLMMRSGSGCCGGGGSREDKDQTGKKATGSESDPLPHKKNT